MVMTTTLPLSVVRASSSSRRGAGTTMPSVVALASISLSGAWSHPGFSSSVLRQMSTRATVSGNAL